MSSPEAVLPVRVAAADLGAAVDALLGNVFAHTPEGTAFRVAVRPRADGGAEVSVAGSGPGVPEASLERGRSGGGSTGLGLDIARRTAESSGGALRVTSSAAGAVVTLSRAPCLARGKSRASGPGDGAPRRAGGRNRNGDPMRTPRRPAALALVAAAAEASETADPPLEETGSTGTADPTAAPTGTDGEQLPVPGQGVPGDVGLCQAVAGWYGHVALALFGVDGTGAIDPAEIVP
ncbi:ATP-binding protein [Geodermatophilus sp. SYSU D00691]